MAGQRLKKLELRGAGCDQNARVSALLNRARDRGCRLICGRPAELAFVVEDECADGGASR
jgi:hypothetical protein